MPGSFPLSSLLSILRGKQPESPIVSIINETSIDLMCRVLSEDDYTGLAAGLSHDTDAEDMLDFMLFLICNGHLSSSDNRRARRLMFKILKTMGPVMPRSLFVTGVSMGEKRDYIANGGFGLVLRGNLQGNLVALKVLYKTARSDIDFWREALMWRSLNDRFVLPLIGIYEDESASQFFLVSPYMTNGTLIQWRKNMHPTTAEIEDRILEVAQGLQYIHSEGVVHGDLRGCNVLLDVDLHVKIADFGLTRISEATATNSQPLSPNFAAPELFGFEGRVPDSDNVIVKTQMSDIYAFGCLYYEIHFDVMPFADKTDFQLLKLISEGTRPPRLNEPPLGDKAWDLIVWCWAMKPAERPAIADITDYMVDTDSFTLKMRKEAILFVKKAIMSIIPVFVGFVKGAFLSIVILYLSGALLQNDLLAWVQMPVLADCTDPLDTIQDWHIRMFRPKWFGLSGEPAPIVYRTWGSMPHQISVVDIDKRDIEIRTFVDDQEQGYRDVDLDPSIDCGDNVAKCLRLGFSSAVIDVPPGWHTVKAEIRRYNKSNTFDWGEERQRRVMWAVKRCRQLGSGKNHKFWIDI